MPRMFTIQNQSGTKSVNLVPATLKGIHGQRDGLGPTRVPQGVLEGGKLAESYQLVVIEDDHDDLAATIQDLYDLLMDATLFGEDAWQNDPVYITQQGDSETNPRQATVLKWLDYEYPNLFGNPFSQSNIMDPLVVTILRTHPWRSSAIGSGGSQIAFEAFFQQAFKDDISVFDAVTPAWDGVVDFEEGDLSDFDNVQDADGDLNASQVQVHDGEWAARISFDDGNVARGDLNLDAVDQTSIVAGGWYRFGDTCRASFGSGEYIQTMESKGQGVQQVRLRILESSGSLVCLLGSREDDNVFATDLGSTPITAGWFHYFIMSKISTGANDGWTRLWLNFNLECELTGLDNDEKDYDDGRFGMIVTSVTSPAGEIDMDTLRVDSIGAPFVDKLAAVEGDYGIAIPIMDITARYVQFSGPTSEKVAIGEFVFNADYLEMSTGDSFAVLLFAGEASVSLRDAAGVRSIVSYTTTDTGTDVSNAINVSGETVIRLEVEISTGAGLDNGETRIYVNDVLLDTVANVDNDTKVMDELRFGATAGLDAGTYGFLLMDSCKLSYGRNPEPTKTHLVNFRDDVDVTHVKEKDAAAYAAIGLGGRLFPAVVAQNDAVIIGSTDQPLKSIVIPKLSDAGVFTTSTLILRYSTGAAAWTTLTLGTDYTCYPGPTLEDCLSQTDEDIVININMPDDAVKFNDGAAVAHYIAIWENNAAPVYASNPYLNLREQIYAQRSNHIEIPTSFLKGDSPPLANIRLWTPAGGDDDTSFANLSRILVGIKSEHGNVNLDEFEPFLNAGNVDNPAACTLTYGDDTASVADTEAPGGYHGYCDFAGTETIAKRVTFEMDDLLPSYDGEYRLLVGVQQIGGDPGDIVTKGRTFIGGTGDSDPHTDTRKKKTRGESNGMEVLDLGFVRFPLSRAYYADSLAATNIAVEILMERLTGTSVIRIYFAYLFPVSEGSVGVDDPVTDIATGSSALRGANVLDIDAGLIADRNQKYMVVGDELVPAQEWGRFNRPIEFKNRDVRTRLYFLMLHFAEGNDWNTEPLIATPGCHMLCEIFMSYGFATLRGAV